MCDSITFSSIISFIALMFSALTVYFNFFDSKSKKLSKKVSITKFRFNEKTGNKTIGDFDILSIFSVDIKNNSDKKIICEHLCLIFKYDNQCQSYSNFCPLIVKIPYKNIIGDVQYEDQNHILYPDEKKKIDLIRFLPKGKVITEKHHTTEEEITRVEPEITFIVDENEWKKLLINIVKLLFG
ncbi:MAG: hypothetical protein RL208_299, partial [Pseudomonadota bacterium]